MARTKNRARKHGKMKCTFGSEWPKMRKQIKKARKPRTPRLLSLPAEIRTHIFELAVEDQHNCSIQRRRYEREGFLALDPEIAGPEVPALLSTCRQIRSEAFGPWLKASEFRVKVTDYNDVPLRRIVSRAQQYNAVPNVSINIIGQKHWGNLLLWCKAIWEGRSLAVDRQEKMDKEETVISAAHAVTRRYLDASWNECEAALERMALRGEKIGIRWS